VFENLEQKLRSKIEASDEELFGDDEEFESVLLNIIKLARKEETDIKLINLQNLSLEFIFAGTQSLQCASASMICHLGQRPEVNLMLCFCYILANNAINSISQWQNAKLLSREMKRHRNYIASCTINSLFTWSKEK